MASGKSPQEWGDVFQTERSEWEAAAGQLEDLVRSLFRTEGVDLANLEARVKEVESFVGKLRRKPKAYQRPLEQMPDIIGLRVITYYEEDIQRVAEILRPEFEVDEDQSGQKAALLDADRFGYLSTHFVVGLRGNRADLTEWRSFAGRRAEIQVRTVLQHAWAAIDHKLRYKNESEIPRGLRRGLFRLSALLEVADHEFSRLRDQAATIRSGYDSAIAAGYLDIELVADSLDAYVAHNDRGKNWLGRALKAGFEPHDPNDDDPDDPKHDRMRSYVLRIATASGIETLEQLDARLTAAVDGGSIEEIVERGEGNRVLGDTTLYDLLANLLLYKARDTKALREALNAINWVDEAKQFFLKHFKKQSSRRKSV